MLLRMLSLMLLRWIEHFDVARVDRTLNVAKVDRSLMLLRWIEH